MQNSIEHTLQNLLKGNASEEEIEALKQAISQGQVSIGGNISQSVIILGNGNSVQLTPQAFDLLDGRNLLGDLERDLTAAEIDFGLTRLSELLPGRAPILQNKLDTLTRRLRATLKTDPRALGDEARAERTETLAQLNLIVTCVHVVALAGGIDGETIEVQFTNTDEKITAFVDPTCWRDVDKGDVAGLRLKSVPPGIRPLRLGAARESQPGSKFRSFGYATAADVQGLHANGTIDGYLPGPQLLQLQSTQANEGIATTRRPTSTKDCCNPPRPMKASAARRCSHKVAWCWA